MVSWLFNRWGWVSPGNNGRSFITGSQSARNVTSTSSVTDCSSQNENSIRLTERNVVPHISSRWLEWGGLNFHCTLLSISLSEILPVDQFCDRFSSFHQALPKIVPLSLKFSGGGPLLDMNPNSAIIKEMVLMVWDTSRCTTCIQRQVKRHLYHFLVLRLCFSKSGPN